MSRRWWGVPATIVLIALVAAAGVGSPVVARSRATGVIHPPVQIENSKNGVVTSTNWSGYAVTYASAASQFTTATGSWVEPTVSCPTNAQEDAAFWVGIDGFQKTSDTVEQVGTDSDCNKATKKVPGGPTYYAWYEFFPQQSINITAPAAGFNPVVEPGDIITATVTRTGSSFALSIDDTTRWPAPFTISGAPSTPAQASSAEWIAEAPSICKGSSCKASKLADFGSLTFTNVSADSNPINSSLFNTDQIDMTKGKKVRSAALGLSGGTSFSILWKTN